MVRATAVRFAASSVARATTERASSSSSSSSSRAVHIKIEPRTRNVHESREILRVLKGFGDVIWYQNLRFDRSNPAPNTLICIYEHASSAAELLRSSPMRFTIPPPPSITETVLSPASMDLMQAFSPPGSDSNKSKTRSDPSQISTDDREVKASATHDQVEFVLSADVSLADHEAALRQKEYSWGFRDHARSFMQVALAKQVPEKGMACLSTETTVPARIVAKKTKEIDEYIDDLQQRLQV